MMVIIVKKNKNTCDFDFISVGDVFKNEAGEYFMKIRDCFDSQYKTEYNAVNLNDGIMDFFTDHEQVEIVYPELVIN